jgi:hypothetical protein
MEVMALATQLLALMILLAGIWYGVRQWIRPHSATLTLAGSGLLLLVIATLMGGFIGSPFWWADVQQSFSWDLPPFAARMLGAAGWAYFAVTLFALRRPSYRRMRLILWLIFVYLAPLAAVIVLFHLDRFDFSAPITYGFFAIVIPMVLASGWYLLRQPHIIPDDGRDDLRATVVVQVWLLIVAFIAGLWAFALFYTDSGPSGQIWSWPGDLLSSRLIGVMLLTIALGSLYAFRYAETARLMLVFITVYSLGVTAAAAWGALSGMPIKTLYTAVFSVLFLVTAVLWLSDRQPQFIESTT